MAYRQALKVAGAFFLQSNGNQRDLNVREAWQQGYTGRGIVVSILDDGIEKNHPDLEANYVSGGGTAQGSVLVSPSARTSALLGFQGAVLRVGRRGPAVPTTPACGVQAGELQETKGHRCQPESESVECCLTLATQDRLERAQGCVGCPRGTFPA